MKVTWTCFLHDFSSMGVIAVNVIRELTKLGVDVGLNVLNINEIQDPSKYPPEIQQAIKKGLREDSVNIFFAYPDIYGNARSKVNVGYTGADTTGWYRTPAPPPAQTCNELMDYMLTPSEYSKKIMEENGVFIPTFIFPHGVDMNIFKYRKRSKTEPFTFLYVGEISRRKGSIELLEVFSEHFKDEKYKLVLRANTHMKHYDGAELERKYKGENIEFHYQDVGQEDVSKFYDQAHIYIYPARADWFGMTPLEAISCGLPTIATSANGYYEFLKDAIVPVSYDVKEIGLGEHPYFQGNWNIAHKEHLRKQMEYVYTYYDQIVDELDSKGTFSKIRSEFTWESVTKKYLIPFLEQVSKEHFSESEVIVKQEKENPMDDVMWETDQEKQEKWPKVTIGIPTKDRPVELTLLLYSLLKQTYKNFEVLIINDCFGPVFETNSTLRAVIKLLFESGNPVNLITGEKRGPHIAGQKILENANTELIFRLDDDVTLEPNCLEEMVKAFVKHTGMNELGAVGPIYLNPHEDLKKQKLDLPFPELVELGKVKWMNNELFLTGILNISKTSFDSEIPVEHLNSGFMYRKSVGLKIGGYCLDFSIAGHREESDFSYRIFKEGYDLVVCSPAIAYHFHPMYGGIRETQGNFHQKENWDHDEKIFLSRMEKILPRTEKDKDQVSVVVLTHGPDFKQMRELIEGIDKFTNHSYELIVVVNDNEYSRLATHKDLFRKLENDGIRYKVIYTNKKGPVSEARNQGANYRDFKSKYICFIDDDARILGRYNQNTDWLDFLCQKFNEVPDVGVVGPIFTWCDELKCHCVAASCMFTSVKVWETVGGFDPVFGNLEKGTWGFEDVDWPYRAQSLGFKIRGVGIPDFPFYHEFTETKKYSEKIHKGIEKGGKLLLSKYDINKINKFCHTVYPFNNAQMHVRGTKLNLGCDRMYLEGWTNIDVRTDVGADRVFNILDISKFYPPNSVSMILMSQILEHFTSEEVKDVLKDVYNVLVPGGHFIVEVPDCGDLDKKLERKEITEWTYQIFKHGSPNKLAQEHKVEFEESSLRKLLEEIGFKNLNRNPLVSNDPLAIRFDAMKG